MFLSCRSDGVCKGSLVLLFCPLLFYFWFQWVQICTSDSTAKTTGKKLVYWIKLVCCSAVLWHRDVRNIKTCILINKSETNMLSRKVMCNRIKGVSLGYSGFTLTPLNPRCSVYLDSEINFLTEIFNILIFFFLQ